MNKEITLIAEQDGERLDKSLAALLDEYSRSHIQKLIEDGAVLINGKTAGKKTAVKAGDRILLSIPEAEESETLPENIPLNIAYEDEDILVVNKAKGMVVHPAVGNLNGTLVNALLYYCGDSLSGINGVARPGIVHRLDKDTSGLLIVAKNDFAHQKLAELIKAHDFTRQYEAIIVGKPKEDSGTIKTLIGRSRTDRKKMAVVKDGREAITHYEVIDTYKGYSHVRLTLETGRTHQIRVHMAYIGHPMVCDEVYGGKPQFAECKGQCLHAKRIAFVHPRTGETIDIESELPDYFKAVLNKLRAQ